MKYIHLCFIYTPIMKKLLFLFLLPFTFISAWAQSELPADDTRYSPGENYKEYGGFLLDMGLFGILPPEVPKIDFSLTTIPKDYSQIFQLNPDVVYSGNATYNFSSFQPSFGTFSAFGNSTNMQMGSFRLKNGMRINTYGDYNADGYRMPNRSALPWERNNFRGAFEMKSANGNFGVRIEVQQSRKSPFY